MIVNEIFYSLQGESSYSGLPCIFIRLAGCNLKCDWCDTPYSLSDEDGSFMEIGEILNEIGSYDCNLVEITGGEPLKQDDAKELANKLLSIGYKVLIETNGTYLIDGMEGVIKIVDVKCPSSGAQDSFMMDNLKCLTSDDEIKFTVANSDDYAYAKKFINNYLKDFPNILFSPVESVIALKDLSCWIIEDNLNVRLQIQLHKLIWGSERGR